MESDAAIHFSPEETKPNRTRPHRALRSTLLVLGIVALALAAFFVASALWGTTGDSPVTPSQVLRWFAVPTGLVGLAFMAAYFFVRRLQPR